MLGLGGASVFGRANPQATDHVLVQIANRQGRHEMSPCLQTLQ